MVGRSCLAVDERTAASDEMNHVERLSGRPDKATGSVNFGDEIKGSTVEEDLVPGVSLLAVAARPALV